jgi:uncharacterized protein (DUF1778 family)
MSTTSLKLPDELKQRAIVAARRQGVTLHAFMLNAIAQAASAIICTSAFSPKARRSLAGSVATLHW